MKSKEELREIQMKEIIKQVVYLRPSSLEDAQDNYKKALKIIDDFLSLREQEMWEKIENLPKMNYVAGGVMEKGGKVILLSDIQSLLK